MTGNVPSNRYRPVPEVVTLPARQRPGAANKPPVRIFLGTEDGQWRAERIFFYAIEQVRDPSRAYEIHLMKNLAGFDRRNWRTGFTNYRFAIPEYAGFRGKAIYNDVDQVYLADPALLFDTDMAGHGYLAVSAEDTSVMLLDCARMGRWWDVKAAATARKSELIRRPASEPGAWGKLADGWNARDLEYVPGESGLLHFTALHLQPWQPFPEDYSYHHHPLGGVWLDMERRADAEGYQVFGPGQPSARFEPAMQQHRSTKTPEHDPSLAAFLSSTRSGRVLAPTLADGMIPPALAAPPDLEVTACRLDRLPDGPAVYDAVVAAGVLEQCPAEDVPWLLERLFGQAPAIYVAVQCGDSIGSESNADVTRSRRPLRWWRQQIEAAARRRPHAAWHLDARDRDGKVTTLQAEGLGNRQPKVWVLEGVRAGDNAQLHCLAYALADAGGWRIERKQLVFNKRHLLPNLLLGATLAHLAPSSRQSLTPPWPDVVIALGKRSSGVARWIKRASGGRTRLVHLGRPWAPLDAFDLVVTTPQYRLPARDNVLHNDLPLTTVSAPVLARRRRDLAGGLDDLPRPFITVLVGGKSWSYRFDRRIARHLGETASQRAAETGGSLLVTTSPRTGRRAADALAAALVAPHRLHRFDHGHGNNPYLDYLAMADELLVTGESASMMADAVATGKPVRLFHPPERLLSRLSTTVRALTARLRGTTYRGTPRQQGLAARAWDAMVVRGLATPSRDLGVLHELLDRRGLIDTRGDRRRWTAPDHGELENTVHCVQALFSKGRPVMRPALEAGHEQASISRRASGRVPDISTSERLQAKS